jgi:hypothetical protein
LDRGTNGAPIAPDNVWDVDCSRLIRPDSTNIHSSYFEPTQSRCGELLRRILRGDDRKLVSASAEENYF